MSKFVISDLHLGHKGIINHCRPQFSSIEEMHELIIRNWNTVVTPRDKVYILGDVTMSKKNLPILSELNGTKTLVMGNHDMERLTHYQKYFQSLRGARVEYLPEFGKVVMTHTPIHPYQFYRFKLNIHGHTHTNFVKTETGEPDIRYYNVCCEPLNYTPKSLDAIVEEMKEKLDGIRS